MRIALDKLEWQAVAAAASAEARRLRLGDLPNAPLHAKPLSEVDRAVHAVTRRIAAAAFSLEIPDDVARKLPALLEREGRDRTAGKIRGQFPRPPRKPRKRRAA